MKNITLSAQEEDIKKAREVATKRHRILNDLFREWLRDLNSQDDIDEIVRNLDTLWSKSNYLKVGKHLSRDELHQR